MTLKDICTSQELSEKLAKAGVPQEDGIAYWVDCFQMIEREKEQGVYDKKKIWLLENESEINYLYHNYYQAFCFNELWEILPTQIHCDNELKIYQLECHKSSVDDSFTLGYNNIAIGEENVLILFNKDTPQEAAGELLLWCIENGYVSPEECK